VTPQNFLLGCTPIINLFQKTTDPLRITHKSIEYRLVPDARLERIHEIHSIISVQSVLDDSTLIPYSPYFSFEHQQESQVMWMMRREPSTHRNIPGDDVYLSFVNPKLDPTLPPFETVYATTLCTNRYLAEQLPAGANLQISDKLPVCKISCLDKPVAPCYAPSDGETLWKLISQLSMHHLGYTDPSVCLKVIKETLMLYSSNDTRYSQTQIEAIFDLNILSSVKRIKQRHNDQAWVGFVRGVLVNLTVNEDVDPSGMCFLLSHVLHHFLAQNASIESFVELNLYSQQRNDAWVKWPSQSGRMPLL
jgi:type VI secretion system protein ImpG